MHQAELTARLLPPEMRQERQTRSSSLCSKKRKPRGGFQGNREQQSGWGWDSSVGTKDWRSQWKLQLIVLVFVLIQAGGLFNLLFNHNPVLSQAAKGGDGHYVSLNLSWLHSSLQG